MMRPVASVGAVLLVGGSLFVGGAAASADSLASVDCVVDCVTTIDTAASGTVSIPDGVTSLSVTVAGGAGAAPAQALHVFPDAVGGAGGVTTVQLDAALGGTDFLYTVGGAGGGSIVASEDSGVLVAAGGGGGAGYAGRLDLDDPDQIFAFFPGGNGGAPAAEGFAVGGDGTAPEANGVGGSSAEGAGGVGSLAAGSNGGSTVPPVGGVIVLGQGGAGGATALAEVHTGGAGGSGAFGGGGAGVTYSEVDENPLYIVGAGGGGSGFLSPGLTGVASTNDGTGFVTFEWSFSPTISSSVSSVQAGASAPVSVAGLPASRAFSVVLDGAVVASGTSDAAGAAAVSFTVPASQRAGAFPLVLTVAGVDVASSAAITVEGPTLAATGAETTVPLIVAGVLLVGGVVALIVTGVRRRRSSED